MGGKAGRKGGKGGRTMTEFRRGDIVRNIYAGRVNPTRYLVYLGKSTITQGRYRSRGYSCITYSGEKIQLFRDNNPLRLVGHMPEFDNFMAALKALGDFKEEDDEESQTGR